MCVCRNGAAKWPNYARLLTRATQSSRGAIAFLSWSFAGVGALWIAFHGAAWLARGTKVYWSAEKPSATFPSPDGQFKAVVFLNLGGGPATSYCGTSVYVVPATTANAAIGGDSGLVYSASCGGMDEDHWENNISWRSGRLLNVKFDPTVGAAGGELRIRNLAAVTIEFSFRAGAGSF